MRPGIMLPNIANTLNVKKHVTPTKYLSGMMKSLSTIFTSEQKNIKMVTKDIKCGLILWCTLKAAFAYQSAPLEKWRV